MAREQFQSLTEQMYYILLALLEPRCGADISRRAFGISRGRVEIGPGTLYTLLAKFEAEGMIREVSRDGRKKYYRITDTGRRMLEAEYRRLERLVEEGRDYLTEGRGRGGQDAGGGV